MNDNFPIDWDEWQAQYAAWHRTHGQELVPVAKAIPGKNFLADEILGTYRLGLGRTVELSEVTFPNLSERDEDGHLLRYEIRAVGLTWVDDRSGTVVHSFAELETELGLKPESDLSLRPRPGETAEDVVERVTEAAQDDADDYLTEAKKETEL